MHSIYNIVISLLRLKTALFVCYFQVRFVSFLFTTLNFLSGDLFGELETKDVKLMDMKKELAHVKEFVNFLI